MLYRIVKTYVKIGLFFFYKSIRISGKENIPTDKSIPILFVANHQNAMMDPLVIATTIKEPMYFLARASAFKNKIASMFLRSIHAIAIYRVRDKVDSKQRNEPVFSECLSLFNNGKNMLIFPEGSHSIKRQVRSLRSGFTRLTIDFLKSNPNNEFLIIPIGLNYDNTINFAKKIHVIIGKPIKTNSIFSVSEVKLTEQKLIEIVHAQLKKITVHISDKNYEADFNSLVEKDYLFPEVTKEKLKRSTSKIKERYPKNFFYLLMFLNSLFPFLIWYWLQPKIKEKEFISTAKFSLGINIFPLFYILQSLLINYHFGSLIAIIYMLLSFVLVFISSKTR